MGAAKPEEEREDLSKIPFFKRLGKKQFWGDVGRAIKKGTKTGFDATKEGFKALGKKKTWVGDNGAFGKETWAGTKGLFGTNNRDKIKELGGKIKNKFKKKGTGEAGGVEEDEGTKKEKERIALTMLKEGQISQEEYDQLVND